MRRVRFSSLLFAMDLVEMGTGNFKFAGSPTVPLAIAQRVDALLNTMRASEETTARLSKEADELKKVLKKTV